MPSQQQTDSLYMDIAHRVAMESYCIRRKVGCMIVTPSLATVIGYNGTPPGWPNVCELPNGNTDPNVIHAEDNALRKAERHGISLINATCYTTLQPCLECAYLLVDSGITRVVYAESYRIQDGLHLLLNAGILVEQFIGD